MPPAWQDYKKVGPIRAAAILTTLYTDATYVLDDISVDNYGPADVPSYNQLIIYVDFTLGSLTSLNIKIEASPDGETRWFQETSRVITTGVSAETVLTHNYTATGKYMITIPIKYPNLRISAAGVGTVTSSSLALDVALGVA